MKKNSKKVKKDFQVSSDNILSVVCLCGLQRTTLGEKKKCGGRGKKADLQIKQISCRSLHSKTVIPKLSTFQKRNARVVLAQIFVIEGRYHYPSFFLLLKKKKKSLRERIFLLVNIIPRFPRVVPFKVINIRR